MNVTKPWMLIIDDNAQDIDLMQIALEDAGLDPQVRPLPDGRAGIQELQRLAIVDRSQWPGCVVLDLNMPITNGHEVLDYFAGEERLRGLAVIVLTTSNAPADRERCLARGATDFLVKPRRFAEFAPIVMILRRFLTSAPEAP